MKLERYSFIDTFTIIIASIIICILIILIGMIFLYRKNPIIKGGNNEISIIYIFISFFYLNFIIICFIGAIEFLILILIGLIINTVNTIFLTFNKTTFFCYQTYLFSNMVIKLNIKK